MSALTLTAIQIQMNLYGYPILMTLGTIGNIFIIIIFNRQRQNPCSLYLMHSAIPNLIYLVSSGFLQIFPITYYDETIAALVLCKFITYAPNFLGQVAKTTLILACIDRYMITSDRARFRAFSTVKRAKYAIILTYIFWLIAASHALIWTTVTYGLCFNTGNYATFYSFYAIVVVGIVPSATLCIFGFLTYRNMRHLRSRIQPTTQNTNNRNSFLQRRDRNLLVLVIAETILYIISSGLFPAVLLELTISQYVMPNKSWDYFLSEFFAMNLAGLLLFFYSAASFYVYMISSKSFRRDFKQLVMNSFRKVARRPPLETTLRIQPNTTRHIPLETIFRMHPSATQRDNLA